MRIILKAFCAIFLLSNPGYAQEPSNVSLIELVANPEKYDDEPVLVGGYLSLEFEGSALYLHEDDFTFLQTKNGLWFSGSAIEYANFDGKYVFVEGMFDKDLKGHMGLYSGTIFEIKRVWLPPSRRP